MKRRIMSALLIAAFILFQREINADAKDTPDELKNLYAQSAVLIDADSGRILFGKNEEKALPMASTTKIMTCIIALERMEDNQICMVSEYASRQPKVHLGALENEKYYLKDLLYSLMLESHNDSAVIIAEAIAGSVEKFAGMMNQKAKEIGCTNTYYITPNGLDAQDSNGIHSTTAKELALIMKYCILESPKRGEFLEITRCETYEFSEVEETRNFNCNNHNSFLSMMEGALSGKTGFTNDAGYCYVGALRQGERTFIVALLACGWPDNKNYKWKDTRSLMEYALEHYEYRNIWQKTEFEKIIVEEGILLSDIYNTQVSIYPEIASDLSDMKALVSDNDEIEVKVIMEKNIHAPVKKDQKVGEVIYLVNGEIMYELDIHAGQEIEKRNLILLWRHIAKEYFLTCCFKDDTIV